MMTYKILVFRILHECYSITYLVKIDIFGQAQSSSKTSAWSKLFGQEY